MVHSRINYIEDKDDYAYITQDPTAFNYAGELKIVSAHHQMSTDGDIASKIVFDESKLNEKILSMIHDLNSQPILMTSSELLYVNDIHEVYLPVDPEICRNLLYKHPSESIPIYMKLKQRIIGNDDAGVGWIDLKYRYSDCPLCGHPLYVDATTQKSYCSYNQCYAFVYRDISRYLKIACDIFGYDNLISVLINQKVITKIEDLYTDTGREAMYRLGGGSPLIEKLISDIDRTIGTVTFNKFIQVLPIHNEYQIIGKVDKDKHLHRYICITNIEKDYSGDISAFIEYLTSQMELNIIMDDKEWKSKYGEDMERYMSIPMFYELFEVLVLESMYNPYHRGYVSTVKTLLNLGVFKGIS